MGRKAVTTAHIYAPGFIHFPRAAWEAIGSPPRVSFKTNAQPRAIAITAPTPRAASYAVFTKGLYRPVVSCRALLRYMRIGANALPLDRPVVVKDGMIIIEIDVDTTE